MGNGEQMVVTGAAGHVGEVLVRRLLRENYAVRAIVHNNLGHLEDLPIEIVKTDICNPKSVKQALDGAIGVFHLAARISVQGDPDGSVWRTNVEGTRAVAEASLDVGVRRLVHCSSIQAFSPIPTDEVLSESRERATDARLPVYDRSKAAAEQEVHEAGRLGLDYVIVNPSTIVGPPDYGPSRFGRFLIDLLEGGASVFPPGGVDVVDVRDVCDAMVEAFSRGERGSNYLLTGWWTPLPDLARLVDLVSGRRSWIIPCPSTIAYVGAYVSEMWARLHGADAVFTREALLALRSRTRLSNKLAREQLNFSPRPVEETIHDACRHFADRGLARLT